MSEASSARSDLIAEEKGTQFDDGLVVLDSARSTWEAIEKGEGWSEGMLNAGLAGLDTLGTIVDPMGALLTSGVAWALEHVDFLREPLDWLAGDPAKIQALATTWAASSTHLAETAERYRRYVASDLEGLSGSALTTYRKHANQASQTIAGLSDSLRGVGQAVGVAGAVVGVVRGIVRDLVSAAVAKVITIAMREVTTLGLATPWVVADITATVSRYVAQISDWVRRLVDAMTRLSSLLQRARGLFDELVAVLRSVQQRAADSRVVSSLLVDDGWADRPLITLRTADGGMVRANVRDIDRVRIDGGQYARFAAFHSAKNAATNAEKADDQPPDA